MAPADWGRSTAPATPGSNRSVAIKVLPPAFAGDAERVARFTREAQVLAALNHPNITALYGIEDSALVMEFVGGEDLSALIARGPLPLEEVRAIARQLADALDAAHQQGIVHRDLKPANIKVRADGTVKVLDFGLARAAEPGADSATGAMNSPTITARTQLGMIIGTAAYMSPEQARGKAVDRRADIWAFGYPRARAASLQLTGESIALADQPTLIFDPAMSYTGGRVASASNGGALAYVSAQPSRIAATWFDMTGRTTPAVALLDGQYSAIRISPDGTKAAVVRSVSPSEASIWLVDLVRGGIVRLSTGPGRNESPVWSPDSTRIVFASDRDGPQNLYVKTLTDPSPEQVLYQSPVLFKNPETWTADGRLLVMQLDPDSSQNLYILPVDEPRTLQPYIHGPARDILSALSPMAVSSRIRRMRPAGSRFTWIRSRLPATNGRCPSMAASVRPGHRTVTTCCSSDPTCHRSGEPKSDPTARPPALHR